MADFWMSDVFGAYIPRLIEIRIIVNIGVKENQEISHPKISHFICF